MLLNILLIPLHMSFICFKFPFAIHYLFIAVHFKIFELM